MFIVEIIVAAINIAMFAAMAAIAGGMALFLVALGMTSHRRRRVTG